MGENEAEEYQTLIKSYRIKQVKGG